MARRQHLIVLATAGSALLLGFYLFAWNKVGRDPASGTIIPLFGPPGGMSPAAVRYVDRMRFDDRGFTAAIINLGVCGHLRIVDDGKASIVRRRTGGRAIAPEEQALAASLFRSMSSVQLVQSNHETLGAAKKALGNGLASAYLGKLFTNNYGWSGSGLLLLLALAGALALAAATGHRYTPAVGLIASLLIPLPFVMAAAAMTFAGWQRTTGGTWRLIAGIVVLAIAAAGGLLGVWSTAPGPAHLVVPVLLLATAAVAGLAFQWLKAPSVAGRRAMDAIEGFRLYLGTAEEDRLNAMDSPEKTPELFERFLPYAVALDVQNAWAKRFAGVLAAAGATAAATAWYGGSRDWGDDPVSFADHLGSQLSQTISSASTAPGSSDSGGGSSGGGSSGGGGGGGGGSSW